jgi:hypothetical protein
MWHLGEGLQQLGPATADHVVFGEAEGAGAIGLRVRAVVDGVGKDASCEVVVGRCADDACTIPLQGFISRVENQMSAASVLECNERGRRVTWATLANFGVDADSETSLELEVSGAQLRVQVTVGAHVSNIVVQRLGQSGEEVVVQ